MPAMEWYRNYIRFLGALKNRLTIWNEKDKWRPSLPSEILGKLKEIRQIKNRFYKLHQEKDRILVRQMTRLIRKEINEYKTSRWNSFLSCIEESHGQKSTVFWKHLSRIYKPSSIPFTKLTVGNKCLTAPQDIADELYQYYNKLFAHTVEDPTDPHEAEINREFNEIKSQIALCKNHIKPTSVFEMKKLVKELKPKKSSGVDNISNFIIKKLPPAYLESFCFCFNEWLKEGFFPEDWKISKIITLNKLKTGTPNPEQTSPISLFATHSKIYEKILLNRIQEWAGPNNIVPHEQSGFRKGCSLQTRVLSIYQEIKNNLAGNIPTLGIYVDYKKAYDLVWHKGLIVKLWRMQMPLEVLKILINWLENRSAYITFGNKKSETFRIHIGLPQGSSLSPYIFIVYHADLISNTEAFSTHIFADDLSVLIAPPIRKRYKEMLHSLTIAGSRICQNLYNYAQKWKQPINVVKTVFQTFHSQVKRPSIEIEMNKSQLEGVRAFKYLGFTWTDKMSLKPTVNRCLDNIQKSYTRLKWLKRNKDISTQVLRICFFAYSFPFFTWIFPFYPLLPLTQQELFQRKYRVGLRIVHRCPFVEANNILSLTKEKSLESYICKYLRKRLATAHRTDLGLSSFYEDIFHWEKITNQKVNSRGKIESLGVGQLLNLARVKKMKEKHPGQPERAVYWSKPIKDGYFKTIRHFSHTNIRLRRNND